MLSIIDCKDGEQRAFFERNGIGIALNHAQDWDHLVTEDRGTGQIRHTLRVECESCKCEWVIWDARQDPKGAMEFERVWFYCEERYEKKRDKKLDKH